ncbi:hypothetical protein GuL6_020 [Buttiauxella phage vB_ButM_GuL6]|nr:hypothetical protein GuL6_020 [Buttiauxella phage vB_ButM_GuL6]
MRIAVFGCHALGNIASLLDSIRWIEPYYTEPNLVSRLSHEEPTPYKTKPYKAPRINRALHRQSVNRGK